MTANWAGRAATVVLAGATSVALVAGPALAAGPVVGAPSAGDPYFPLQGNGGYDVGHYSLRLRYDPATRHLDGRATIRAIVRDFDDDKLEQHVAVLRRTAEEVVGSEPRAKLAVDVKPQYPNMRSYLDRRPETVTGFPVPGRVPTVRAENGALRSPASPSGARRDLVGAGPAR